MTAADLICSHIEALSQDEETARAFDDLHDLICYAGNGDEQSGLREVLRMLIDAADSAIDVHEGDETPDGNVIARMKRFSEAMRKAAFEVSP
jgi:hypothetical protein